MLIDNPSSTLTEEIFYFYFLSTGNLGYTGDSVTTDNLWFVNNFPNSIYVDDVLYRAANAEYYLKNVDNSAFDMLDTIIKNHPGTVADHVAQELITSKRYLK